MQSLFEFLRYARDKEKLKNYLQTTGKTIIMETTSEVYQLLEVKQQRAHIMLKTMDNNGVVK